MTVSDVAAVVYIISNIIFVVFLYGFYNITKKFMICISEEYVLRNRAETGVESETETYSGLIDKSLLDNSSIEFYMDDLNCAICKESMEFQIVRELNCYHTFHVSCVDTWFIENNTCPNCRMEI